MSKLTITVTNYFGDALGQYEIAGSNGLSIKPPPPSPKQCLLASPRTVYKYFVLVPPRWTLLKCNHPLDVHRGTVSMIQTKSLDLFAGIAVADYATALKWYERLLGSPPTFFPHDTEAVWELAEHRYLYVVQQPENAGHAMHTLFVGDLDALVAQIADRGLDPANRETYSNGVCKITYRDADGNEIGFGGALR